uniref:Uncharacterized protein n=1 Tax=Arundo donax TaxID=35708 RepID=A0A0A9B6G3_ARUDO
MLLQVYCIFYFQFPTILGHCT